mgnify:CR=1 FL=1
METYSVRKRCGRRNGAKKGRWFDLRRFTGNDIEITRGDSLMLRVVVSGRELPQGTILLFSVKRSPRAQSAEIERRLTIEEGTAVISLSTEDTDLPPRTYFWDARVLIPYGDGTYEVKTPMEYAAFQVLEVIGDV